MKGSLYLLCRKVLDAVCTHVTSSAASRDSAVKLTTDSYQFWVAYYNLRVTFQSHIRILKQTISVGAVPELIVGEVGAKSGVGGAAVIVLAKLTPPPPLHTSV